VIGDKALSRLGFGVTGPHAGWGLPRRETHALIRRAVGLGMTFFDTGPAYGNGEAERRLGEALHGFPRDRVFVATKAGIHAGRRRDFSPGAIEMSFKASLDRLKCNRIDLLLLHGPAREEMDDRLIRRLEAFKARGLLRHIGVCGRGPELDHAISLGVFDAIMAPVNSGLDSTALARLRRARESGHTVIGIEVMAGAPRRLDWPRSRSDLWYAVRSVKQRLTRTVPGDGARAAPEALKWALENAPADALVCLTTRHTNLAANARLAALERAGTAS
jgi:aryl-alcohol dehydrogenase-like predicted oxidoreductase